MNGFNRSDEFVAALQVEFRTQGAKPELVSEAVQIMNSQTLVIRSRLHFIDMSVGDLLELHDQLAAEDLKELLQIMQEAINELKTLLQRADRLTTGLHDALEK